MRNLSKTIVSEKATLMQKELTMKIIYFIIAIVMAFVANSAQADANVSSTTRYVLDTVPVPVTVSQARRCALAYHNGGTYRLMNDKIALTCTERQIRKEWDPEN